MSGLFDNSIIRDMFDTSPFPTDNTFIIALHARKSGLIAMDSGLPYMCVFTGTDLNTDSYTPSGYRDIAKLS